MKRFLLGCLGLILIVVVLAGGYLCWHFVIMGPRLGEVDESIAALSVPPEAGVNVSFGKEMSVRSGGIMLSTASFQNYQVYLATTDLLLEMPTGTLPNRMKVGEPWGAYHRKGDGSLLLETPDRYSPSGYRLALNIDAAGRVVGEFPWYDLATRRHVEQLPWGEGVRDLFQRHVVPYADTTDFLVRYEGVKGCDGQVKGWEGYDGCVGVIKISPFRVPEGKTPLTSTMVVDDQDMIRLEDVEIRLHAITPENIRFDLWLSR